MNCYTLSFCSLRKFFRRSIITDARFDERLFYHEDREGHEGRIRKVNLTNNKSFFLRALRALRDDIHFSFLVAALPR